MKPTAVVGVALIAMTLAGGCDDDSGEAFEPDPGAVNGEYGTHVAIYEQWYAEPTRGDLADNSDVIDRGVDAARKAIAREAGKGYNNGEVVGEPHAAFAVDTAYGSIVYAIGHITYDINAESYTASGVPLPFAVVVMLNDRGKVAHTLTERPVSQAESGTTPPEQPIGLAAYADPAGHQLLVLDTGPTPWVRTGLLRSPDPARGPIAVGTPELRPDVSKTGYAILDTGRAVPYTASLGIDDRPGSGEITGPAAYPVSFEAFYLCCPDRTIAGEDTPLTTRDARQLARKIMGDRISPYVHGGFSIYQALLPDGGLALIQDVATTQTVAARLGNGREVAAWCANPSQVKSFVCRVPTTDVWVVGSDRKLQTRTDGGSWHPVADLPGTAWTTIALVEGDTPQMRIWVKGEWVTVDLVEA